MLVHELAHIIAESAHAAMGQRRKYTQDPYMVHPESVVAILAETLGKDATDEMFAVAYLHDVIEDTKYPMGLIRFNCGAQVATAVALLTNSTEGNRATRKAADIERLAKAPGWVQSVKVADLIDNTRSIVQHDPDFSKVYMREKRELLAVLTKADERLLKTANEIVDNYYKGETYYRTI